MAQSHTTSVNAKTFHSALLVLATLCIPAVATAGQGEKSDSLAVEVTAKVSNPVMMADEKATNFVRNCFNRIQPAGFSRNTSRQRCDRDRQQ